MKLLKFSPFIFKEKGFEILKCPLQNARPDKGRGVVTLNKSDFVNKMPSILYDAFKFVNISKPLHKLIHFEDEANCLLSKSDASFYRMF